MQHLETAGICADLLLRRYVPKAEMLALDADMELRAEVERRLEVVGLVLVSRPGVPFFGVVAAEVFRSAEHLTEYGMTKRHQAMLLYLWARLVAPFVYGQQVVPEPFNVLTISKSTLRRELGKAWSQKAIDISLGFLRNLAFVDSPRGSGGDVLRAGPMLWLAIDHARLGNYLRDYKALDFAVRRVLAEREAKQEEGESVAAS